MPLQKQLLPVPLSSGLGQKSDVRSAQATEAIQMVNCVRLKNGAIRKRFGHTALSLTYASGITNLTRLQIRAAWSFRGTPCLSDGQFCQNYSDEQGQWTTTNVVPSLGVFDRVTVSSGISTIVERDMALASNGLVVCVYTTPFDGTKQQILYSVLDMSGGSGPNTQGPLSTVVIAPAALASATASVTGLKVIACGTKVIVTWQQNAALAIQVSTLDVSTLPLGAWSAPTTLVTPSAGTVGVYDINVVVGDTTRFVLLYELAATNTVRIDVRTTSTLANNANHDFDSKTNFTACANMAITAINGAHFWIAYTPTSGTGVSGVAGVQRVAFFNELGSISATPVTFVSWATGKPIGYIGLDATETPGAQCIIASSTGYSAGTVAMNNSQAYVAIANDNAGVVNQGLAWAMDNVQLGARPWVGTASNRGPSGIKSFYAVLECPSQIQGTQYVVAVGTYHSAGRPQLVAVLAPRLLKQIQQPMNTSGSFTLPHVARFSSMPGDVAAWPTNVSTTQFRNNMAISMVDANARRVMSGGELGASRICASAVPILFDGGIFFDSASAVYPELATPTAVGSGGSLSAGTYQYIAHYETRNAGGETIRGATSVAVSVTTVNNDSVNVVLPTLDLTTHSGASSSYAAVGAYSFIALYRTTANGTLFYRVTPDPPTAIWRQPFGSIGFFNNFTFVDTMSDATLTASATAQLLYTTGGVLDNFSPPASRCAIVHVNRFWLAGCDSPTQVWPSKALTSGESPGFNEAMNFNATGAVRALASLDDKLVIFVQRGTQYGIEYVTGQGPTDIGTQSDFTPPQPIPADVGAVDQRGTCVGPFGVLFRSPVGGPNGNGGIHLLSRDLQVQYLSGPVEDTLNANPIVTSMVVHPNAGRVYITCVPTETGFTSGVRLVWDYTNGGVWSIDQMFDADTSQASAGAQTAWVSNTASGGNAYHWATAGGRVYRETNGTGSSSYLDGAHFVQMTYQTSWLKPEIGGFARFWNVQLRADSLEAHDFTMTLTYDYAPSSYYSETYTWTAPQMATFDRAPQINVQMTPGNQKAESIQVTLQDATPTGGGATTGQGPSWAAIVLELGVKEGAYRNTPPGQRA